MKTAKYIIIGAMMTVISVPTMAQDATSAVEQATKIIVTALLLLLSAALVWLAWWVIPFPHTWSSLHIRYVVLGLLVPIACVLWLLWSARISSDYRTTQAVMKFVLLMGVLYGFVINRML